MRSVFIIIIIPIKFRKVDILEKELSEKHHLVINKERSDEQVSGCMYITTIMY